MALSTPVIVQRERLGFGHLVVATVNLDNSYPTNGYALTAQTLGIGTVVTHFDALPKAGYIFEYDFTNSKLKVYRGGGAGAAGQEVANAVDLSAVTGVRIFAIGH